MYDSRVVIRDRILIILARRSGRLDGIDEKGGTVESGAEAGDQGAQFYIGANSEGTCGAAEDVGSGGLGEGQTIAEVQEGGRVNLAGDSTP